MKCDIEMDGGISIRYKGLDLIRELYPGVDGHGIHALLTERTDRDVFWKTAAGDIKCRIGEKTESSVELIFSLENWKEKIHTFSFLHQANVDIKGFYQAAEGMGETPDITALRNINIPNGGLRGDSGLLKEKSRSCPGK